MSTMESNARALAKHMYVQTCTRANMYNPYTAMQI